MLSTSEISKNTFSGLETNISCSTSTPSSMDSDELSLVMMRFQIKIHQRHLEQTDSLIPVTNVRSRLYVGKIDHLARPNGAER